MTTTLLRATADLAGRSVLLEVTDHPGGPLELWRTDSNGRRRVRLPRGAAPAAGAYSVRDREAALTGSITYEVAGAARTNHVPNPGFEVDTSGWTINGTGATLTRDTGVKLSGAASGKITIGTGAATLVMATGSAVPVTAGEVWTMAATCRGAVGATYDIRVLNQLGTAVFNGPDIIGADTWRTHEGTITIPAGTTAIRPAMQLMSGGPLYLDNALIERAPRYLGFVTGTVSGQLVPAAAPATLTDATRPAGLWIHAAAYPTTLATFTGGGIVGSSWRPTRDTGAQLVEVIGRADPIDTGPALARTRAHTVDVRCDDLAAARSLEDLAAAGRTVVIRHNTSGLDSTLIVEDIDGPYQDPANPLRWHVILRGRETLTGPYLADAP